MLVIGCLAYACVPSQKKLKLDSKTDKCIFMRYRPNSKSCRIISLITKKFIVSKDVMFDESSLLHLVNFSKHSYVGGDFLKV